MSNTTVSTVMQSQILDTDSATGKGASDSVYICMLHMVLNVSWKDNIFIYQDLPRVTDEVRARQMRLESPMLYLHLEFR